MVLEGDTAKSFHVAGGSEFDNRKVIFSAQSVISGSLKINTGFTRDYFYAVYCQVGWAYSDIACFTAMVICFREQKALALADINCKTGKIN